MYDDIPEARRQKVPQASPPRFNPTILIGSGLGLVGLALGVGLAVGVFKTQSSQSKGEGGPAATKTSPDLSEASSVNAESKPNTTLGHFAYEVAPENELEAITTDGRIRLRGAAAQAYQQMSAAAAKEGVTLLPLSGFRTVEDQDYLFFKVKEERVQGTQQRAKVSAPPRHSEHHTGYAIDIGDASQPNTYLSTDFEKTAAFAWLTQNAPRYSFELSFPKGNSQGVSYEPWHWRYVGDQDSLETFYNARNQGS
ncbi:MAG: D-alanyl-D-alanine carboxypeptidase family protein [Acaryochloridaceae cyanobacterium CSU_3_4]|nr:D-alanyl-D-alanine carboxypeptidase family protein [Acaryochloridaceae cyanobacterium CSU_3_4]